MCSVAFCIVGRYRAPFTSSCSKSMWSVAKTMLNGQKSGALEPLTHCCRLVPQNKHSRDYLHFKMAAFAASNLLCTIPKTVPRYIYRILIQSFCKIWFWQSVFVRPDWTEPTVILLRPYWQWSTYSHVC